MRFAFYLQHWETAQSALDLLRVAQFVHFSCLNPAAPFCTCSVHVHSKWQLQLLYFHESRMSFGNEFEWRFPLRMSSGADSVLRTSCIHIS